MSKLYKLSSPETKEMVAMIKNDRQYRISKDWVDKFKQTIASLEKKQQQFDVPHCQQQDWFQ